METSLDTPRYFLGIDVQVRRACPYFLLDGNGAHVQSGWLPALGAPEALRTLVRDLEQGNQQVAIGIDAPRTALVSPRRWSWRVKTGWNAQALLQGTGRHCEVVIAACRLANPQWTPLREAAPEWMRLGFALFEALDTMPHVYEVFPSASYRQLAGDPAATISFSFAACVPGPKDMLDAALAALTVREFLGGRGCEVGGGDGLGTIILPRPLHDDTSKVHRWPSAGMENT
jgi:predicted nuclease with RNAse H fold